MDMKIIEEESEEYRLVYDDVHGNGYAFPCDKNGDILWETISCPEAAKKNLAYCKAHPDAWATAGEVVTLIKRHRYGICPCCGRRVCLGGNGFAPYMGLVECECGQWYNVFGQALKPPEDWDEEPLDEYY